MSHTIDVIAGGPSRVHETRGRETSGRETSGRETSGRETSGRETSGHDLSNEFGQSTVEYVLVMLAAAGLAVALITWIGGTDLIPSFFDTVFQTITGYVG